MISVKTRGFLSIIWLLLFAVGSCWGQVFPGRIAGTVRDAQGASVGGATLKLTNPATGLERVATSDENGDFNFPELSVGTYQLTVSKSGFNTAVLRDITTSMSQVNTVTAILTVGSITTQVEVTTAPALMQTETNSAGGQLSEAQVSALPVGNSDYTRLALVLPGAVQNSNFAFAQFSINGSRARSNGFNIDGISNTDPSTYLPSLNEGGNSATAATRLPLDAVEEVSVVSGGGADNGQNSGSVMNVIVKSGTNQFHGSAYELHRDAALDAANFFENSRGVPKAPFVWNEFGASAGGPVYFPHLYDGRNRTFFFTAYDGSRLRLGTTLNGLAPTPADIQDATAALASANIQPNQLGLNIAKLYTSYQGLNLSGPFVVDNRGRQSPNSFIFKLDHKISESDSLSARLVHATGEDEFPGGGPGPGGGSQLNPFFGVTPTGVDNFAVSEVHVFSPRLINTLRLGWNRFSQFQKGRDFAVDPATVGLNTGVGPESFGLPEIDIGSTAPCPIPQPTSPCSRYSNLGLQNGAGGRVATNFQVADDVNLTRGSHAIKLGFNFLHNYSNYTLVGSRGILTFDGSQEGDLLVKRNSSISNPLGVAGLIDLLAGLPTPGLTSINRVGSGRANIAQNLVSGYAMDTYKVTTKITLIAGLRYDFFGTVDETRGRFSAFDPALGLVPESQLPGGHLYDAPKKNFGPRIAVAWAPGASLIPGRQMIWRAGYGIYYDTFPLNNFEEGAAQNPIGPTAGFQITPAPPIPFDVGVPIFGTGAPQPPFNITSVDPRLKTPNTQVWNLNWQQELSPRFVLQLGYVGNKSTHQLQLLDINQPAPGPASADNAQSRRPFNALYPTLAQINTISSVGWANYHSFQMVLKSTDFHGLTMQTAFTWSHNLDTASEVDDFFGTSGYVPQDSTNLKGSYGNSEFDQRRSLIITYIYAIPSPKAGRVLPVAARNWQLSGTTTFRDGLAAPILSANNSSGTFSFHERPDCVGPFRYQLKDFSQPYVDPSAFFSPPAGSGVFGNCPRNPIVAPGLNAWDIAIQRTFKFGERFSFEFRTAFFNAFNHPNFAEPSPVPGGTITATADDGSFDSHFGVGGPRNIQFSGKIRW